MKTKILTLISIIALSISSCSEVDKLLTFTISQETEFTVNSTSPIDLPIEIDTPPITTNSSAEFKNNNTKADLVKDVKLKELKLTITDPSNQTFDFLKSVHVFISTDNSDEIELAYLDDINSTSNTINLSCTTKKLDKYIKASSFKLRTKMTTRKATSSDVTMKADMKFRVTADPL